MKHRSPGFRALILLFVLTGLACNIAGLSRSTTPEPTLTAEPTQTSTATPEPTVTTAPIMSPTPTLLPFCTPPACGDDEVYYCEGACVGGCGTTCATVTPDPASGAAGPIGLTTGAQPVFTIDVGGGLAVNALAWSPDSFQFAIGTDRGVMIYDFITREIAADVRTAAPVRRIVYSHDSQYMFVMMTGDNYPGEIWLLGGLSDPTVLVRVEGAQGGAFHPTYGWLAMSNRDILLITDATTGTTEGAIGDIVFWNTGMGMPGTALVVPGMEGNVYDVTFSPDGSAIAASGGDSQLVLMDLEGNAPRTYSPVGLIAGPIAEPRLSADWSTLAWISRGTVIILDRETGLERTRLNHEDFVVAVDITASGGKAATASGTTISGEFVPVVTIFDAIFGTVDEVIVGFEGFNRVLAFSPDGTALAVGGEEGIVTFWEFLQP